MPMLRGCDGAIFWIAMPLMMGGCATAPLDGGGSLTSYADLTQSDGVFARSKLRVNKDAVLAARTLKLAPTTFSASARQDEISDDQRKLIANVVDRSLCGKLSERFQIVPASEKADLTVRAVITHMTATDEKAVAVTKVASVAKSVLLPGVPVPVPRLPIGLGSLSIEAEARTEPPPVVASGKERRRKVDGGIARGEQVAAMVWGRGANALWGTARVSSSGDAYEFASAFGDDFSKLLVTGESPFNSLPTPSLASLQSAMGGAPKNPVCEAFGRAPGVMGIIGGAVGAPPEWTDKGAPAEQQTAAVQ
ncbi:DUF3313 domain-containing protein [Terrarubrum flagellatum]|uniref:DUF3313 domain-containing protein n=1 Tax=Terrirubrum flagellatum TaxID=2895980 RepID=UPI00314556E2